MAFFMAINGVNGKTRKVLYIKFTWIIIFEDLLIISDDKLLSG